MATSMLQNKSEGTYTFASQPRALAQRKKYRESQEENEGSPFYGNIMYDKRIVRGNTFAQHTLPASAQPDPIEAQRQQEARRRALAKKRAKQQMRVRSPEPVEGRRHTDVQTELYLEELSDRIEEAEVECQTDAFLDRPPSPLFVPAKSGIDKDTQILEGELFDFNIEVQPMLEVLVGKTMEQALVEVMEEEELANLREQQRMFEEMRATETVEKQRLEEQERRHRQEKERRMKQQEAVLKMEAETAEKIAARAFAQSYLADLVPTVFGSLSNNGYFYDPVEREVEKEFLPWLMGSVDGFLQKEQLVRKMMDVMVRNIMRQRSAQHTRAAAEAKARAELAAVEPVVTVSITEPSVDPTAETVVDQADDAAATTTSDVTAGAEAGGDTAPADADDAEEEEDE